jgi:hypothetical protein
MDKIKITLAIVSFYVLIAVFIFLRSLNGQTTWKIVASLLSVMIGILFIVLIIVQLLRKK